MSSSATRECLTIKKKKSITYYFLKIASIDAILTYAKMLQLIGGDLLATESESQITELHQYQKQFLKAYKKSSQCSSKASFWFK